MPRNPLFRSAFLTVSLALAAGIALALLLPVNVWVAWLIGINAVTALAYCRDKRQAQRGGRRIREITLWSLGALFGTIGAFAGIFRCRNKTRKVAFLSVVYLIGALQFAFAVLLVLFGPA